jgi:hypothetical protein
LAEHRLCKAGVRGSIPLVSTPKPILQRCRTTAEVNTVGLVSR